MPKHVPSSLVWLMSLLLLSVGVALLAAIGIYKETVEQSRTRADAITGGNWRAGGQAIARRHCGSCHVIPGIAGAVGKVGPDLTHMGKRSSLAGSLTNDPDTLVLWIMHPQKLHPGSGMPEQGVGGAEARDMAAYLYSRN